MTFTITIWGTQCIASAFHRFKAKLGLEFSHLTFNPSAALEEQQEFYKRSLMFPMWMINSYLKSILSPFWLYLRAIADPFLTHRSFKYLFTWSPEPILVFCLPTAASQPPMWLLRITQISQHWRAPGFKPWTPLLFYLCSNSWRATVSGDKWHWYPTSKFTWVVWTSALNASLMYPTTFRVSPLQCQASQPQSSSSLSTAAVPTLQPSNHIPSHPWTPFFRSDPCPMYLLKCSVGKSMLSENIYPKRRKGNRRAF